MLARLFLTSYLLCFTNSATAIIKRRHGECIRQLVSLRPFEEHFNWSTILRCREKFLRSILRAVHSWQHVFLEGNRLVWSSTTEISGSLARHVGVSFHRINCRRFQSDLYMRREHKMTICLRVCFEMSRFGYRHLARLVTRKASLSDAPYLN